MSLEPDQYIPTVVEAVVNQTAKPEFPILRVRSVAQQESLPSQSEFNPGIPSDNPTPRTYTPREPTLLSAPFTVLAESRWAKSVAMWAGLMIGGGALSISGCSEIDNPAAVAQRVERDASFSTFPKMKAVSLQEIDALVKSRAELGKALEQVREPLRAVTRSLDDGHKVSAAQEKDLDAALKNALVVVGAAKEDPSFSNAKTQLLELSQKMRGAQVVDCQMVAPNSASSPEYLALTSLQDQVHVWSNVIERDQQLLNQGLLAKRLAEASSLTQSVEKSLSDFAEKADSGQSVQLHQKETTTVKSSVQDLNVSLERLKEGGNLRSIHEDIGDAQRLLNDSIVVLSKQDLPRTWDVAAGGKASAGRAVLLETAACLKALRTDFEKELRIELGAEQKPGAEAPLAGQNTPAGGQVVHHHHSSPWIWYMNRSYGYGGYHYVPGDVYHYSGSSRLRSSPEYAGFAETSKVAGHSVGGLDGVSSHPEHGSGRAVDTSHASTHGNSGSTHSGSSSHSTPIFHGGGFGGGHHIGGGGFGG